ncbi:hypothetical protein ABZ558_35495 [Streptomyces coeruleorubidus]
MSRLRESGLLTLLVPAALGEADWPTAYAVVRRPAKAAVGDYFLNGTHPPSVLPV